MKVRAEVVIEQPDAVGRFEGDGCHSLPPPQLRLSGKMRPVRTIVTCVRMSAMMSSSDIDAFAGDLLIEELGFLLRRRSWPSAQTRILPSMRGAISMRKNSAFRMTGGCAARGCAGVYVKHQFLRLAPPAARDSGGGVQGGGPVKNYTPDCAGAQSTVGERATGYNK